MFLGGRFLSISSMRMRWKSRVVVNGGDTRTVLGLLAEGADLYTCPLSLGTLRAIGAVSLLDDESELLGFDFEAAYTQGRRQGPAT